MNEFAAPPHPDSIVETAFATLPVVPLPPGFTRRTLARLTSQPTFRLDFLDLAMPLGVGVFAAALLFLTFWLSGNLTSDWLPHPTHIITLPSLKELSLTFWVGAGILILAVEAMLALLGLLAYSLWSDPYSLRI